MPLGWIVIWSITISSSRLEIPFIFVQNPGLFQGELINISYKFGEGGKVVHSLRYQWEPYVSYGQKRHLKKNSILFRQGEKGRGFYYLHEGQVAVKLLSDQGMERIIDYLPEGYLLGEQGLREEPYFTTVIMEKNSTLYYFSTENFQQICYEHPEASDIFMNSLIQKVRLLAETVSLLNSPLDYQMAHFVYKLYQKYGTTNIPISQTALARYIGTSRITVYKILQKWIKNGWIEVSNRSICICNLAEIEAILNFTAGNQPTQL